MRRGEKEAGQHDHQAPQPNDNAVDPVEGGGVRITSESTVEVEGAERPALIAETISMQFE